MDVTMDTDNTSAPNTTTPTEDREGAVLMGVITAAALFTNTFTLILFTKVKLNSFDIYLINLLIVNLLYLVIACPLDMVHRLHLFNWPLSDITCSVYLYTLWTLQYLLPYVHLLISFSRVWAVAFPVHYSRTATISRSVGLCAAVWLLAHVITLPGLLLDEWLYRRPINVYGCQVNLDTVWSQKIWLQFLQIQGAMCEALLLLVYPYIRFKKRQRDKLANARQNSRMGSENRSREHMQLVAKNHSGECHSDGSMAATASKSSQSSYAFLLLTLLTFSLFLLWTPNIAYFLLLSVADIPYDPVVANVVILLFNVQIILDPVLFFLAMGHLRTAASDMLRKVF
ncbi:5-hydroxytryptamine receptor 1D-like [Paramacrobiotus metropolitanus]|uniref:5-hydroxytryptamine receptor 1D-like n=1 Tax=Paramacrobiotus metropolitanus TaxID=2943436 RepID=UPI002445B49C|nr:5-hydroxytryptamine receptor 1D-like [Paramacrobiotus metropolitanus]